MGAQCLLLAESVAGIGRARECGGGRSRSEASILLVDVWQDDGSEPALDASLAQSVNSTKGNIDKDGSLTHTNSKVDKEIGAAESIRHWPRPSVSPEAGRNRNDSNVPQSVDVVSEQTQVTYTNKET